MVFFTSDSVHTESLKGVGLYFFAKASGPVGQGLFFVYSLLLYHPLYH